MYRPFEYGDFIAPFLWVSTHYNLNAYFSGDTH